MRPAGRSRGVLVEEVSPRQHLELVDDRGEYQQYLGCPPALVPLNLANLVRVEVDVEPAEHSARRRAHETVLDLVCRLLLEKKKTKTKKQLSASKATTRI